MPLPLQCGDAEELAIVRSDLIVQSTLGQFCLTNCSWVSVSDKQLSRLLHEERGESLI